MISANHLLVSFLIIFLLSGCVQNPSPGGNSADYSPSLTSPQSTETDSTDGVVMLTNSKPDRLSILSRFDEEYEVVLVNNSSGEIAFSETYSALTSMEIEIKEELDLGTTYNVRIRNEGHVVWNETIVGCESYWLSITPPGHVEVEGHGIC